jgi:hypothetical protein
LKNLKRLKLLTLILLGLITYSCQNQDDYVTGIQEPISEVDTSKLIDFKGLLVSHRFSTPVEELTQEHTIENLQKIFKKVRVLAAKKKGLVSKNMSDNLPDMETISAGAESVMDQFPFKQVNEVSEENQTIDIENLPIEVKEKLILEGVITKDGYELVEEVNIAEAKQKTQTEANLLMIQKDFPTLTKEQIKENTEIIDAYYAQNLDYVALKEIADKPSEIAGKVAQKQTIKNKFSTKEKTDIGTFICIISEIRNIGDVFVPIGMHGVFGGYSFTGAAYAMAQAKYKSEDSAKNNYGLLGTSNTRRDAYRHIVWSALLAQYYPSISSKNKALNFAKDVGNANEKCGDNLVDGSEMDFHNNTIGRKIWNDNTSYRKFWGMTYGLNRSSYSRLKTIARYYVNYKSCFIVKESGGFTRFPENKATTVYSAPQMQIKIQNTPADVPVYILGPIRENTNPLPVNQYDYSNCTSTDLPWKVKITKYHRWIGYHTYTTYKPCVIKTSQACFEL